MLVLRFRCPDGRWPSSAVGLLAFLAVGLILPGCRPETVRKLAEPGRPEPQIRVKMGQNQPSRLVNVLDNYQIYDVRSRRLIASGDELAGARFTAKDNTLLLNDESLKTDRIVIVSKHSEEGKLEIGPPTLIGKRRMTFRGKLRVIAAGGKVGLVNVVSLEEYLASVVGKETYGHWHIETLKAQAIAARSYALYHMKNVPPSRDFDVYAGSAKSQAYGEGTASENEKSRQAVKATRGVVLTYNDDDSGDRIFEAFYHSTCGGRTVPVQHYFTGGKAVRPLGGVKCNYCTKSKHFRWQYRLSAEQLRKNFLSSTGGMENLDRIGRIEVLEEDRTADGRAKIVSIWTPEEGSPRWPVPVAIFKKQVPAGVKFKTDRFTVAMDGSEVVVEGHGFGHGIGMCQFGAEEQARRGRRAAGILRYYYPGSKLVRVY